MKLFFKNLDMPGPGIRRDAPKKKGLARFWEIIQIEYRDLFKLNLYFIFTCLGIITIPASIVALNGIIMMMVRDIPRFTIPDYTKIFRREFKKATGLGFLLLLCLVLSFYGAYFYWARTSVNVLMWVPAVAMIALFFELIVMSFYAFPMIACVDLGWKQIIKNSFLLSLLGLKQGIPALLILAALYFMMLALFPVSLLLFLLGFFGFVTLITCFAVYRPLNDYVFLTKDDLGDKKKEENEEEPEEPSEAEEAAQIPDELDAE